MRPTSEAELSEAIRAATGPLAVRGGGTRPIGRPVAGDALETGGLSGIVDYEPGALTLVARAGTPMAEIEAALATERQMLAFEPMDHRVLLGTEGAPTIGGVVAGNVSGPRRVSVVGACRDSLLGVRFVDGTGRVVKNGGRVMKNVTGYDLTKLMAGARGTLGVLTEVSLKVLPRPETETTLVVETGDRLDAMTRAMTSPFELSGAACLPARGAVYLRLEGFAGSVAYRAERLTALLAGLGTVSRIEGESSSALWRDLRDVRALAACDTVWKASAAPSHLFAGIVPLLDGAEVQFDWAGGLAWIGTGAEGADSMHSRLQAAMADPRIIPGGGHVTLVKGSDALRAAVPVFQPQPAPLAALTAGLKAKFDPSGILNAGLMT